MASFYEDFKKKKEQNSSKSAKASDVVKVTPTRAVTKTLPKATKVTTSKQTAQKKAQQQRERAAALGLDSSDLLPLPLLKRDAVTGTTTKDKITYAKTSGLAGKRSAAEIANWKKDGKQAARQKRSAAQTLSKSDKKLSKRDRNLIRDAKTSYDEAKEKGDTAGMKLAHKRAETIRKGHGYSGGATGEEYNSPELSKEERVLLNQDGQERLKMARMNLEAAQAAGNENGIAAAERAVKRILETDAFRNEGTKKLSGFVTGHGQTVDRKSMTLEEFKDAEKKFNEGLYSAMAAVPGSILSLVETSNKAIENSIREKNRDYIDRKANELDSLRARLALAKRGEGNPAWGTVEQLEQQVKIAENLEKLRSSGRTVDPNLPGQTLMRKSTEARQKFMEGRTGVNKLLASAGLSMAQMVPALAASAIPGVGPAVGAGIMGAQAAGSKAYELNERGVSPAEAQMRGIVSGGIEALTEKIPISSLLKAVKAGGGASLIKTMAKQAGIEATEESVSYALNYAADVAAKDPEAKFSMKDLLESAAVGAISGGTLGGVGSVVGSKLSPGQTREAGTPSRLDGAIQSAGNKIADKASFVGQAALLKASGLKDRFSTHAETPQNAAEDAPAPTAEDIPAQEEAAQQAEETQVDRATERVDRNLVNVIHQNKSVIDEAGVLARLTGNEFSQSKGKRLTDQVAEFFASLGNKVTRLGFGDVALTRRGAKDSIMHGVGRNKAIAFSAVPSVIENGVVIDEQADWKGRGYDSITFGGKIRIANETYNMGVIVRKYGGENPNAGRYYLHEVVLTSEDGASVPIKTGTLAGNPSDTETPSSINHSIPQNAENVNADHIDNIIPFPEGMGAASRGFDPYTQAMESEAGQRYNEMVDRYGSIEGGEIPKNVVDVPKSTNGRDTVSKFARTYAESESMTDKMIHRFTEDVAKGYYSYSKKGLKQVQASVKKTIEAKGFDGALEQWQDVVDGTRRATDEDIALAQTLLSSATAAGDVELSSRLAAQIAAEGTSLGRAVNAFRLLKRTTPEGRLYYLNRSIEKINQQAYDDGKNYTVNLNGELAQALLGAETEAEIEAALEPIYDDIAGQIPPTISDRINAWRYLAMLGNPRTHIRNAVGNVIFGQTVKARDSVSALLQNAILRGDKADIRTRSVHTDKAAKEFAKEDFENVKGELGGNRYDSDFTEIQKRQNKLGPVQKLADFNSDMMTKEDTWAKKHAYIRSLANYLTAKGIDTTQDIPPNILMDARAHAIEEANYCTFQNFSELAQTIQSWEDRNAATKLLIGGTMPFKRTPINITKAAVDFSPVGLGVGIYDTAKAIKRGDVTAAEGIDKMASGLTGSAIAGLGALLVWRGWLRAGDDDEDKTGILDDAEGSQEYSLVIPVGNIPGVKDFFGFQEGDTYSYTIDWAAPAAIPLFMGAEIYHALMQKDEETTFGEAVLEGVMRMFDPVIEMTCMSGFSSAIRGAVYNQDNPMYGVFSSVAQNYAGQFVPTLLSQIAKTIDPVKRTTYYDANSKMPKLLQQIAQQNANKIPGLSQNQPAALDVWGREVQRSDNLLIRALQNFVSPGEAKKVSSSPVDDELRRLHNLGYEGMMPSQVSKSSKLNDERISAEQWSAWQKEKGQSAYNSMKNFMETSEYQALTDDQKAKFVNKVYDFASASGKVAAGGSNEDMARWITAANESESEVGMPREKFISLYAYKSSLENELDEGDFSASIKQGVWEEYIDGRSDLTGEQKSYVKDNIKFYTMNPASSSSYNKAKNAGYTDLEDIQALIGGKKEYDRDGNQNYSSAEIYDYISSATDDNAEREKMWNALKDKGDNKTWYEFAKEAAPKLDAERAAKQALDNAVPSDRQASFASAVSEYGTGSQGAVARALMSVNATDSEREAYYNYIKAKRGWKKSWSYVKTYKIND